MDDVKENGCLADPNYFESEILFLYGDIRNWQTPRVISLREGMPRIGPSR
jgi:hypothetical protein